MPKLKNYSEKYNKKHLYLGILFSLLSIIMFLFIMYFSNFIWETIEIAFLHEKAFENILIDFLLHMLIFGCLLVCELRLLIRKRKYYAKYERYQKYKVLRKAKK